MRQFVILFLILMMAGCAGYDKRTYTGLHTTAADSRLGTVIFVIPDTALPDPNGPRRCLSQFSEEEVNEILANMEREPRELMAGVAAPLILAGVSFASTYVVESINAALEEYQEGLSGSFGAAGTADITPENIRCIGIVRGLLGTPANLPAPHNDRLISLYPKLGFRDYPAFYMELYAESSSVIEGDSKSGFLTLTPVYVSYADSAAKNHGSGKKHVGVALAFSEAAPKKLEEIDETKAFAFFRHDLGRLDIGKHYHKGLLKGTGASASLDEAALKKQVFNIAAVISDSEDPGIAFEVLSKTFTDRKSDLKKALEEAISNAINKTK